MMAMRQARLSNIFLTLAVEGGLHITPGESLSIKVNSSMSSTPNVQLLLMGKEISFTIFIASIGIVIDLNIKSVLLKYFHIVHWNSFIGRG